MGSFVSINAACLRGVEAVPVTVEVAMSGGIPSIHYVGMADGSVLEGRQRVRSALRSAGYELPRKNSLSISRPAISARPVRGSISPSPSAFSPGRGRFP